MFRIQDGTLHQFMHVVDTLVIPEGVTRIGKAAFRGCRVHRVVFPTTLTHIEDRAFERCTLVEVDLPEGVTLGTHVFKLCTRLERASVAHSEIPEGTFQYCTALRNVKLPYTLTHVGKQAFESCAVRELELTCQTIGDQAFRNNLHLKTVYLTRELVHIDDEAFQGCTHIDAVDIPDGTVVGREAFRGCWRLKYVGLGRNTCLGDRAFQECTRLEHIDLPEGTVQGDDVFYNCIRLKS